VGASRPRGEHRENERTEWLNRHRVIESACRQTRQKRIVGSC
jgi:hypothetical protein